MVHVSFDLVKEFVPRVPQQRCPNENDTIERICVAPDVLSAMQSIPQCGEVMYFMRELGLPIIIHAYYMKSDNIIENSDVQKYVPDAEATREMWILDKPKSVYRVDYEITDFLAPMRKDMYGTEQHFVFLADKKRCKYQSNIDNFFDVYEFGSKESKLKELFEQSTYRTVLSNLGEEMIERLKRK